MCETTYLCILNNSLYSINIGFVLQLEMDIQSLLLHLPYFQQLVMDKSPSRECRCSENDSDFTLFYIYHALPSPLVLDIYSSELCMKVTTQRNLYTFCM